MHVKKKKTQPFIAHTHVVIIHVLDKSHFTEKLSFAKGKS